MEKSQTKAEIQTEIKINCCKECSVEDIEGYCNSCEKFFCKECRRTHLLHETETLDEFYESRKKKILDEVTIEDLTMKLEEKRSEDVKEGKKLYKEYKNIKREIRIGENRDTICEEEIECLEMVTRYLAELKEEVFTVTLKNACEEGIKVFNVEDKIKEEFEGLERSLKEMKTKVEGMKKELQKLKVEVKTLNYLRDDGKYEFDEEKWKVFLLLNEKISLFKLTKKHIDITKLLDFIKNHPLGTLKNHGLHGFNLLMSDKHQETIGSISPDYCIKTMENFEAFPSVTKVFDIDRVMKEKLVDVGEGVKMTRPLKVKNIFYEGVYPCVSLSHQGILSVFSSRSRALDLMDLNTSKRVFVFDAKITCLSQVGFYDNMILLIMDNRRLREATVKDVFENPVIETFKKIEGTDKVNSQADVSLLHERRVLYYHQVYPVHPAYSLNEFLPREKISSFNVDTRVNERIYVRMEVYSIVPFTGIDCGVKTVFCGEGGDLYSLNMDNTVTRINKTQDGIPIGLLPSASNQKNIADAVLKYRYNLVKSGNVLNTNDLMSSGDCFSIVRVYKDIFLTYNQCTRSWVLFRIVVP